ncbi:uncharacterized protein LOC124925013 [Impatiens glandulifera]|uniref:uncharacterized protein LOC124925013 n=1 Tax=Impatiens glandulifera TaxID=253017 RepID=UPI001FB11636|nr:uncharacterized protein LOC124925013 [Impatiens glandulifera]
MNKHHLSGEIYYGGASVGIPFLWESAPGTPKVKHHHHPLPPLTPPPSFLSNKTTTTTTTTSKKPSRSATGLFHAILPKLLIMRKSNRHPSSPTNSSSSSESSPFTHAPWQYYSPSPGQILRSGSRRSLFLSRMDDDVRQDHRRSSVNCFGITGCISE